MISDVNLCESIDESPTLLCHEGRNKNKTVMCNFCCCFTEIYHTLIYTVKND